MADDDEKPPSAAYEVGYGKPPKSGRFRPGQSGNPGGRTKGAMSAARARDKMLNAPNKVKLNGEERTLSTAQLAFAHVQQGVRKGDARAVREALRLSELADKQAASAPSASQGKCAAIDAPLSPEQEDTLLDRLRRKELERNAF